MCTLRREHTDDNKEEINFKGLVDGIVNLTDPARIDNCARYHADLPNQTALASASDCDNLPLPIHSI